MGSCTVVQQNGLYLVETQLRLQVLTHFIEELLVLLHVCRPSETEYCFTHAVADGSVHSRGNLLAVLSMVQRLIFLRPRLRLEHPRVESRFVYVDDWFVSSN